MVDLYQQVLIISVFVLLFTLVSKYVKDSLYLPETLISLIFGILIGKHMLNLIRIEQSHLLIISRILLCIQTMNVSLSLPKQYIIKKKSSLLFLVLVIGLAKCIFTFIVIYMFKDYNLLQSWQVSSSMTPTDPILSSSIIKGKFASSKIPQRIRILLLAESGINDGLGILLLSIPKYSNIFKMIYHILYLKLFLSIACGLLLGFISKMIFKYCYQKSLIGMDAFIIHTYLLISVSIGLMEILGGSEFICIFFCGIPFSSDEFISIEYDRSMQESIDSLLSIIFFVIFGSTLQFNISLSDVFTGFLILFIRRPLVCYTLYENIKEIRNVKEALFIGWFGPVGVGAIYYGMMVDQKYNTNIYDYICNIVLFSVIIHGVTVLAYRMITKYLLRSQMIDFN